MSRLIRILYLDDNPLDRERVRDALTQALGDFELLEAASRAHLEATLVSGDFDLVLSDLNTLDFEGLQVLEIVHAQDPNLPVVIVTGAGSEEIAAEAMRRGASDYVIKTPQHLQRLPQTLRAVLDNKRTKEAQREIEQQYRILFETTPIGIGVADLEGNLLTFNDAILVPGGYTRDDIKKMGGVAGLYSEPGQRHAAMALLKTQGFLRNHPIRFKRKDGTAYEALLTLTPIVFHGQPCLQAMVEDVTDRVRAEAALRESTETLRALFQASPVSMVVLDSDGNVKRWNPASERMFGWSETEVLGKLPPYIPRDGLDKHRALRQRVLRGESFTEVEVRRLTKDGSPIMVSVSVAPLHDATDQITGMMCVNVDITERKRAEAALKDSEERLRTIIETEPECVKIVDSAGQLVEMNAAGLAMLEAPTLCEAQSRTLARFILPEHRAAFLALHKRVMEGESGTLEFEIIGLRGTRRWLETHAAPMRDATGAVVRLLGVTRDITECKQAEAALRQSEEKYRAVVENAADVIYTTDVNGNFIYCNLAGLRAVGYSLPELQRLNYLDLVVPEHHRRVSKNYFRQYVGKTPSTVIEFPFRARSGEVRWFSQVATLVLEEGIPAAFQVIARDITERKQMEKALRESHDLLQSVFSGLNEAVLVVDKRTRRIQDCNPMTETMFGYRRDELVGHTTEMLHVDEASFNAFGVAVQHALAEHTTLEWPFQMRRRSGEVFPTEHFVRSIHAEEPDTQMVISVVRDITTRVRAEAKLRQLSQAVEQSPATILITDTTGAIQYANPAFIRTSGYTLEEALGQNPRILKSGETPPEVYAQLWRTLLVGGDWRGELHNRKKSGELYWESTIISPIKNDAGRITHFLSVKEDITERKQAEAELAATNARLEQAVWEANQLAIAAQAANRLKSEILANTSHELRTPLTGILGSLGLILEGLCDTRAEERSFIVTAYQSSRHLLELINNLLDLAKIEAGKMEVELQPVDLAVALAEVETLARAQAQEKGLVLRVAETPGRTLWAKADPEKVRQILLNVVNNAIKFTEQGEVEIAARADPQAGVVRLTVRDTGIGVPLEQQAKLFQPFVQVDGTSTRRYGGSGLGLSLSRQFAEVMNGSLTLESTGAGQGCTLTLTLPCGTATGLPLAARS